MPTPLLDLKSVIASLGQYWPKSDKIDTFSAKLAQRPAQNTLIILGLSATLFYYAERNINPRINSIYDALEYCSSSLSVGFTGIYPQTPMGKLIASALMTYGPALSNAVLNGPQEAPRLQEATQEKILATLEQILAQLQTASNQPQA